MGDDSILEEVTLAPCSLMRPRFDNHAILVHSADMNTSSLGEDTGVC